MILCVETSQSVCSAAVFSGEQLLGYAQHDIPNEHNKMITLVMEQAMKEAEIKVDHLEAVAVSEGPGSYTGLRVGSSACKAYSYAMQIPLIPVDTLQLIAFQAQKQFPDAAQYISMIDARRMEVFMGSFDNELKSLSEPKAFIVKEDFFESFPSEHAVFAGNGAAKLRMIPTLTENTCILSEVIPLAKFMGPLAYLRWKSDNLPDPAYFEPRYLKSFGEKAVNDTN